MAQRKISILDKAIEEVAHVGFSLRQMDCQEAGYRCANFKKKFVVAYLDLGDEILICDFAIQKLLASK